MPMPPMFHMSRRPKILAFAVPLIGLAGLALAVGVLGIGRMVLLRRRVDASEGRFQLVVEQRYRNIPFSSDQWRIVVFDSKTGATLPWHLEEM